jgi:4,5-dihydroxyphthalate decarboxylase
MRKWDWLTPWFRGDVFGTELADLGIDLNIETLNALPDYWDDPATIEHFQGGETSLSKYVRSVASGDRSITGYPHVLMQGFRHRCVITRKSEPFTSAKDLIGKRIGLTGWADSGNTWTRAALADDGLKIDDAHWFVGRLTATHPVTDRLDGYGAPGKIEDLGSTPMVEALEQNSIDAILTPFMPPGFFSRESPFRPLYQNVRAVEQEWVQRHRLVPGHHILSFQSSVDPKVASAISRTLETSQQLWRAEREKMAETSQWLAVDFYDEMQFLPPQWHDRGLTAQAPMIHEFCRQLEKQRILRTAPPLDTLFPCELEQSTTSADK